MECGEVPGRVDPAGRSLSDVIGFASAVVLEGIIATPKSKPILTQIQQVFEQSSSFLKRQEELVATALK